MKQGQKQIYGTRQPMQCGRCGTTGVLPRMMEMEDNMFIYTEAKYICPTCGEYFHKTSISKEAKTPNDQSS
jgi:ribosomal protein S27AE